MKAFDVYAHKDAPEIWGPHSDNPACNHCAFGVCNDCRALLDRITAEHETQSEHTGAVPVVPFEPEPPVVDPFGEDKNYLVLAQKVGAEFAEVLRGQYPDRRVYVLTENIDSAEYHRALGNADYSYSVEGNAFGYTLTAWKGRPRGSTVARGRIADGRIIWEAV